jgi:hypothetical protein
MGGEVMWGAERTTFWCEPTGMAQVCLVEIKVRLSKCIRYGVL